MQRTNVSSLIAVLLFALELSRGQGSQKLEFEVASMRLSIPRDPREERPINGLRTGGPGSTDPGRIAYTRVPLDQILADAFEVPRDQIRGPDFIVTQRYDIAANVPEGSTQEQAKQMLQNLLADRIHLASHLETKILPGYELVVTASGPRLTETAVSPDAPMRDFQQEDTIEPDTEGFPILPSGVRSGVGYAPGHTRARFRDTSMTEFAKFLGGRLGDEFAGGAAVGRMWFVPAPVLDKTGLMGRYDFTFDYEAFPLTTPNTQPDVLSAIEKALDKQLGMKVVEAKVPVRTLVIDHIEKTLTEN